MYSNGHFDVSLDGKILSHTTTRNAFVLTPALRICTVGVLKERKCQVPVAIFGVRDVNVLVAQGERRKRGLLMKIWIWKLVFGLRTFALHRPLWSFMRVEREWKKGRSG